MLVRRKGEIDIYRDEACSSIFVCKYYPVTLVRCSTLSVSGWRVLAAVGVLSDFLGRDLAGVSENVGLAVG